MPLPPCGLSPLLARALAAEKALRNAATPEGFMPALLTGKADVSVFDLLEDIRKRPAMYVGLDASDRAGQLRNLELLLAGYAMALDRHGIVEPP
jgi:hypothetical protein